MKAEVKNFTNVYGYPTLNRKILKALEDYTVAIGVEHLFSTRYKPDSKITIIIDSFSKLRTCGIPILGYTQLPSMVYVRSKLSKHDIVANSVQVSHPVYLSSATSGARPSIKLLLEFNDCKTVQQYKELQCKYEADLKAPKLQKFKWLRRNLNQILKDTKDE